MPKLLNRTNIIAAIIAILYYNRDVVTNPTDKPFGILEPYTGKFTVEQMKAALQRQFDTTSDLTATETYLDEACETGVISKDLPIKDGDPITYHASFTVRYGVDFEVSKAAEK